MCREFFGINSRSMCFEAFQADLDLFGKTFGCTCVRIGIDKKKKLKIMIYRFLFRRVLVNTLLSD